MLRAIYAALGWHTPGASPFSNLIMCVECGIVREPGQAWWGGCHGKPRRWSTICLVPGCGAAAAAINITTAGRFCGFHETTHRLVKGLVYLTVLSLLGLLIVGIGAGRNAAAGEARYMEASK